MKTLHSVIMKLTVIVAAATLLAGCTLSSTQGPTPTEAPAATTTEEPAPPPTDVPTTPPGEGDLAGTAWVLAEMNGSAPLAETEITLLFSTETELGGSACNNYGGGYIAGAGTIQITEVFSTMMACMEPEGIMEQEQQYLAALGEATTYQLEGDTLTIGTAENPSALVFIRGTAQPAPESGSTYQNEEFGFQVSFPATDTVSGGITNSDDLNSVRFELPFTPDTNLQEKYLEIDARSGVETCSSPITEGHAPESIASETVTIGDTTWTKESGGDAGAGNFYDFTAYSTMRDDVCVSLTFVLHSLNAANFDPPATEFDRVVESAVFEEIVATFQWLQ